MRPFTKTSGNVSSRTFGSACCRWQPITAVQREEPPYEYVVVGGTVVDTVTPAPRDVRETIAIRYLGDEAGRAFVEGMGDAVSVLFTVRPDRWITATYAGDE